MPWRRRFRSKILLPPLPVVNESRIHYASRLLCFLWSSLVVERCQLVRFIVRGRSKRKWRIRCSRTQTVRRGVCAVLKTRLIHRHWEEIFVLHLSEERAVIISASTLVWQYFVAGALRSKLERCGRILDLTVFIYNIHNWQLYYFCVMPKVVNSSKNILSTVVKVKSE